jgi:hypothetical protein
MMELMVVVTLVKVQPTRSEQSMKCLVPTGFTQTAPIVEGAPR